MLPIKIKSLYAFISKEATNKNNQLKTQMLVSFQDDESKGRENGFFGDQRAELTIVKANFTETNFCFVNQGSVSLVKGGEKALYLDFIVLSQLMSATNVNPEIDLDSYILKGYYILHEVFIYCPVYNKSAGMYGGLTRKLGYITLRGDDRERFYFYGFNKEKSSLF